jgi:hypothetical protein
VSETRKLAAILVSDIVGYSRLAGADEDRILARLRTLRSDLIDPTIAVHHGRVVKRTGDGSIIEFRSVVDAVRCAIEVQNGLIDRNAGVPEDRRIQFRVGIHVGDVVEEADGDLMGDGVNIAARTPRLHLHDCQGRGNFSHGKSRNRGRFWEILQLSPPVRLSMRGKIDEAKAELAEARRLNPAITVKWMTKHWPNLPAVFDGLRKAGMPEE